ncbi:MAG: carboxypeptidase-like regulatory domain-containing protein [Bryobacteraceae bacterium]|nr:carboxypeptidase-like regulatory domain-containing protein [Bryobacteraceae bacterium]
MRGLILLVASVPSWACSCVGETDVCAFVGSKAAIFVARVIRDSGEGYGKGPARVAIEEALQNVPAGLKETEIETMAGSSCYYRLEAGERYVIVSSGPRYAISCSPTFLVRGNEYLLEALRRATAGELPSLIGFVSRPDSRHHRVPLPGVMVKAVGEGEERETQTDGLGHYSLHALAPGRYKIEVSKPGYLPDEPVLTPVTTSRGVCVTRDYSLTPAGRVGGTVRDRAGRPLTGVTVQAFEIDQEGERKSDALRIAKTGPDGKYAIQPLPPGGYAIAVNGAKYEDEDIYPPTFFSDGRAVALSEAGVREGIDLVLPPPRKPARLKVTVVDSDGNPFPATSIRWRDMRGRERGRLYLNERTTEPVATLYIGERYIIEVSGYWRAAGRLERWQGSVEISVDSENPSVVVTLRPTGEL